MAVILLVLILAILFGGLGFVLHALWRVAAIAAIAWLLGFAVRTGEGRASHPKNSPPAPSGPGRRRALSKSKLSRTAAGYSVRLPSGHEPNNLPHAVKATRLAMFTPPDGPLFLSRVSWPRVAPAVRR
jgi:hypothetical protein